MRDIIKKLTYLDWLSFVVILIEIYIDLCVLNLFRILINLITNWVQWFLINTWIYFIALIPQLADHTLYISENSWILLHKRNHNITDRAHYSIILLVDWRVGNIVYNRYENLFLLLQRNVFFKYIWESFLKFLLNFIWESQVWLRPLVIQFLNVLFDLPNVVLIDPCKLLLCFEVFIINGINGYLKVI